VDEFTDEPPLRQKWLDVLWLRHQELGCNMLYSIEEDVGEGVIHLFYQSPEGQLQHSVWRLSGLQEPSLIVRERLFMAAPP